MQLLDPKNDAVFKLLLTRRAELLPDMLTGVLERPVLATTIVDPTIPTELPIDKDIAFDVRAELDDGSRADIEMQRRIPPATRNRLVYYGTRDYANQLDRGDEYHFLEPTAVVAWLVDPLFPDLGFHSIFELRDRHTEVRFSDHLAIHLLQLGALPSPPSTDYAATVHRWARFFLADPTELHALASEDPIMSIAKKTLEELSQDPMTRRIARAREDARKLRLMENAVLRAEAIAEGKAEGRAEGRAEGKAEGRAEGKAEGRAEGRAEGEARVLLKLLDHRFGSLSETTIAHIRAAKSEQLEAWTERVLSASSLDEVLAP